MLPVRYDISADGAVGGKVVGCCWFRSLSSSLLFAVEVVAVVPTAVFLVVVAGVDVGANVALSKSGLQKSFLQSDWAGDAN